METENNPKEGVHVYELGFHLVPLIAEEQLAAEVTALKATIEGHKAAFIAEEFPALRSLAYSITKKLDAKNKKFTSAYFGWIKFEAPAEELPKLKTSLDANKNILRYLLIHTVRENTLIGNRIMGLKNQRGGKDGDPETDAPAVPVATVEEMDKSIDKLVIQ